MAKRTLAIWVAVLLVVYGVGIFNHGLFEDNEARYFEISWEMYESGDWVTPRLNFIKHFHKPPLTYWVTCLSFSVFGLQEAAGRIPITLLAFACMGLTGWLAHRFWKSYLPAVLLLATSLEFWLLSRLLLTDMYLALSVTLALVLSWEFLEEEARGWQQPLFWAVMGLSALIKGPVGPVLVLLTLIPYLLWAKPEAGWKKMFHPLGLAVGVAVTLPWFVRVCQKNPELFEYLFYFQTVERVATTVHGRPGPFYFYLPVILVGLLPWSFSLPAAVLEGWKEKPNWFRFVFCWLAGPLLLFSLSGSKLPTYLLPLFPAFALLLAGLWQNESKRTLWLRVSAAVMLLFSVAVVVFVRGGLPPELSGAEFDLYLLGSACMVTAVVAFFDDSGAAAIVCVCTLLFGLGRALPVVDTYYTGKELAASMQVNEQTRVAVMGDFLYGLPYYLRRRIIHVSYPRELQFESEGATDGYYYDTLEEFLTAQKDDDYRLILRWKELEKGGLDERNFNQEKVGKYVVLRPASQPADPSRP